MRCVVEAKTLDDVLRRALKVVLNQGERDEFAPTRGGNLEVLGARLEVSNPRARLSRSETRRKPVSAIAELCWYLRGTGEAEPISFWIPKYADEAESDGRVHGAYGPRLFGDGDGNQVERVVELLAERPGTRRAVIQLFDRADIAPTFSYKDVPCTCTVHFLLRSARLHAVVHMRSSDVYLGLPHDVFAFSMLQEIVARELGVEPGRYIHMAGSLHLYDNDLDRARTFLEEGWQSTTDPMAPMPSGSQWRHVSELLRAEAQIRAGVPYKALDLPGDPYWSDLARVLALHQARKRHDPEEGHAIVADLVDEGFSAFA